MFHYSDWKVIDIKSAKMRLNWLINLVYPKRFGDRTNLDRKEWVAWYLENQACFKKEGLTKRIVLHELYHHLVEVKGVELSLRTEEKEANTFARSF